MAISMVLEMIDRTELALDSCSINKNGQGSKKIVSRGKVGLINVRSRRIFQTENPG